jgi:hypothetical protein
VSWRFSDFYLRYIQWVADDDPPEDFKFWVMAWLYRLQDDPRSDAAVAPGLREPWWFAKVPHAENDTHAVVCPYSIEDDHVRCSGITSLRKPIT